MAKGKSTRHASALKAERQSLARRTRNYEVRSKVRTITARVQKDIAEKNLEAAKANFKKAQAEWQKAAKRGVFARNAAARKVSGLASRIAALAKA